MDKNKLQILFIVATCWMSEVTDALYDCDYSVDLCGAETSFWTHRDTAAVGRPYSGPEADCMGNKGYLYFPSSECTDAGSEFSVDITFLEAPLDEDYRRCLIFSYHVWGPAVGGISLDLYAENWITNLWRIPISLNDEWHQAQVSLDRYGTKVVFTGKCGAANQSDLAIDNVAIYSEPCPGIQVLPFYCGFEDDDPLCGFQQSDEDNGEWRRVSSPNPYPDDQRQTVPVTGSRMTEPEFSITNIFPVGAAPPVEGPLYNGSEGDTTDYFMLMFTPDLNSQSMTKLVSPLINVSNTACCVGFKYHMYGDPLVSCTLEVTFSKSLFRRRFALNDAWHTGKVTVGQCSGEIAFTAYRESQQTNLVDIAIDEVWVVPGVCNGDETDYVTGGSYFCDFVDSFCGLVQTDSDADWRLESGESLSRASGYDSGPNANTTWSYLYVSPYEASTGYSKAEVQLATFRLPSISCLEIDYYMHGSDVKELSISVSYLSSQVTITEEWFVENYDMGDLWRHYSRTLDPIEQNVVFNIHGIVYGEKNSDLALTNLRVSHGACAADQGKIGPLPWFCDFESDEDYWCHMHQTRLDGSNEGWIKTAVIPERRNLGTGPAVDHTTSSPTGKMLYFSSLVLTSTKQVTMGFWPDIRNETTDLCLTFHYYMHGRDVNRLLVSYGGISFEETTNHIWHQSYDQGDLWRNESFTLRTLVKMSVFFTASSAAQAVSDIAIDDISLTEGECLEPTNERDYLPFLCDFELGWCNMQQGYGDFADWRWHYGMGISRSKGFYTGPDKDADSNPDGHYAYYQSALLNSSTYFADLTTPELRLANSTVCLSFHYHMYGRDVGMLRLDQLIPTSVPTSHEVKYLWHTSFAFTDAWYHYSRTFTDFAGKVRFRVSNYINWAPQGDIAIDNFSIINGTCPTNLDIYDEPLPFICDFETTICNFKQFISNTDSVDDGDFRWQGGISVSRKSNLETGPLFDGTYNTSIFTDIDIYNFRNVTTCEDLLSANISVEELNATDCVTLPEARYLYFCQGDHLLGKYYSYIIGTPIMEVDNVTVCLSFRYHMYGYDVNRLTVFRERLDLSRDYLWHQRYNHEDNWWKVTVTVPEMHGRILFKVDGGSGRLADVGIDDVILTAGPCPLDTGFTTDPLPWSCDFEVDFCNVVHDYYDADEWRWESGVSRSRERSEETGPFFDATYGNESGHYALFDASDIANFNEFSYLKTPVFNYTTSIDQVCLSFSYYSHGLAVNSLWLYLNRTVSNNGLEYIWHTSYTQSNQWYNYSKTVNDFTGQFVFKAIRGSTVDSDFAIDDIHITEGHCREAVGDYLQVPSFFCDFETSYCDMVQSIDDDYEWRRYQQVPASFPGSVYFAETGAVNDHTYGNSSGYSLHLQSSYTTPPFWYSVISTPKFNISNQDICVDFYYHMYGIEVYMLELFWAYDLRNDSRRTYIWHQSYDQDNEWFHFYKTIADFQGSLVFVGHRGWSSLSYIELDDISVYPAPCDDPETILLPLNCTFEHGYCFLDQNRHDDVGDFHRPKGKSLGRLLSYDTGPSVDHTYECQSEEGKYVYLHKYRCSDCEGQSAILDSMEVNVTGQTVLCLQFWYYFYGTTVDTLKWSIIQNDFVTKVWSLSSDQGDKWVLVQVNVTVTSSTVRFRLEGVYGSGMDSDIALDDLSVYGGRCQPVPECNTTVPSVAHSTSVIEGTKYGDVTNYTCDEGYMFPSGEKWDVLICDNGQWRCPLPDCEIIHCEPLPTRQNLKWSTTNTEWNTTVQVTCDPLYRLTSPEYSNITCLDSRQWDKNITKIYCVLRQCPDLPTIAHLQWRINDEELTPYTDQRTYLTEIRAVCDRYYEINSKSYEVFVCTEAEEWAVNVTDISCDLIHCPEIPAVNNGSWLPSSNNTVTSRVQLNCDVDHVPANFSLSTFTCLETGQWDKNISLAWCRFVVCATLPSLPHLSWDSNLTAYNPEVRPICDDCYRLSNESFTVTCFYDVEPKQYPVVEDSISCLPISCPPLPILDRLSWSTNETNCSTTVYPSCQRLFELSNPEYSLRCTTDGQWTNQTRIADEIACVLIHCPTLQSLANGNWSTSNTTVLTEVKITCDAGYILVNAVSEVFTCTEEGSWSIDVSGVMCEELLCPELQTLSNLNWILDNRKPGSTANASCQTGYELIDPDYHSVTCLDNATWSGNISRIGCKVVECPPLPNIEGVHWNITDRIHNTVVGVSCDVGYTVSPQQYESLRCTADGTWDKNISQISCTVVKCSVLPIIERGQWNTKEITYNTEVRLSCDSGYLVSPPQYDNLTCTADGTWNKNISIISCIELLCPELQTLSNLNWILDNRKPGSTANASCQTGYELIDPDYHSVTCLDNATWSGNISRIGCKVVECPPLPSIEGVHWNITDRIHNTVVGVSCDVGYTVSPQQYESLRCTADGTWDKNISQISCTVVECSMLPIIERGQWNTKEKTYNTEVRLICDSGYLVSPPQYDNLTCTAAGTWDKDTSLISCMPVKCPALPTTDGVQWSTTEITYDTLVKVQCETGYILNPPEYESLRCTSNGTWDKNASSISCTEICLVLNIFKAIPSGYEEDRDKYFVTYSCLEGYEFNDQVEIRRINCDKYGIWRNEYNEMEDLTCTERECPALELAPGTLRDSESHWFGDVITYYCKAGYEFEDGSSQRTLICMADGKWHTNVPVCLSVSCPRPPESPDYTLTALDPDSRSLNNTSSGSVVDVTNDALPDQIPYGTVIGVRCNGGLRLPDGRHSGSAVCTADGTWNRAYFACIESTCDPVPYIDHASHLTKFQNATHVIVKYECEYGYRLRNGLIQLELTCSDPSGGWNYDDIEPCLVITCPRVQRVANADPDTDLAIWGTIVTFICHPGYRVVNRTSYETQQGVECLVTGYWNRTLDDCEAIECPLPSAIPNADVRYSDVKLNSFANYTCLEGQRFPDGNTFQLVQCGTDRKWSELNGNCQEDRCPPPPTYSRMEYTNISVDVGTDSILVCEEGYYLSSNEKSTKITCLSTGKWSPLPMNCRPVDCGPLPLGEHMLADSNKTEVWTAVNVVPRPYYMFTVDTNSSYQLENSFAIYNVTCLPNSSWTVDFANIRTEVVKCSDVPRVPYAMPDRFKLPLYGGAEIGYICGEHYRFPDRTTWKAIKCLPNGSWETILPCELITCPSLGSWQDFIITPTPINYTIGSVLNISCPDGYFMEDGTQQILSECIGLGDWDPIPTTCWKEDNMVIPVIESEEAVGIGLPLIIIIIIITSLIVISDFFSNRQELYNLLRDLPKMPQNFAFNFRMFARNVKAMCRFYCSKHR